MSTKRRIEDLSMKRYILPMALHLMVKVEDGTAIYERGEDTASLIVRNDMAAMSMQLKPGIKLRPTIDALYAEEIQRHREVFLHLLEKLLEEFNDAPIFMEFALPPPTHFDCVWEWDGKTLVVPKTTYSTELRWSLDDVPTDASAIFGVMCAFLEKRIQDLEARYRRFYELLLGEGLRN